MGWFDEQIRQRISLDDDSLSNACLDIAGAVMGRPLRESLNEKQSADSALSEILKYYKINNPAVPPASIKDFDGQMDYILRSAGIARRDVYLEDKWYTGAVGPMLGSFKDSDRAVALIPGRVSGYYICDSENGTKVRVNKKTAGLLQRDAVCFYQPLPQRAIGIPDLIKYMLQQFSTADAFMIVFLALISTGFGLLLPGLNSMLFSDVLNSGSVQVLTALGIFMLSITVSRTLISTSQSLIIDRIGTKQSLAINAAVMMRIFSLPADFFKKYNSGELSRRMGYVEGLCSTIMNSIMLPGLTSVCSLAYITQIFKYAPGLVIPAAAVILATTAVSILTSLAQIKLNRRMMKISTREYGLSYSMITGIQKIKLSGAEKRAFTRWAGTYAEEAKLECNPPFFVRYGTVISSAVSMLGMLIMYYAAIRTKVSVSDYYAFNTAYSMLSGALTSLTGIALSIAGIKPTIEMAKPILDAEPETSDGKEIITGLNGGIEINNVSFKYEDGGPLILDNLSLKIKPGQYVAIVGKTGCGKSTLMRLLLGFEKPVQGDIYYDGKSIGGIDLRSLRRNIGSVTQNGKLFQGDILSNITISAPQLSLDEAWEAAEMAGIAEDIRAMPMGMFTYISEGSGGISGGQKQRIMIARAVAPKPKILFFDEATSALDNITQKKVSDAVDKLKCTRIVIAHRLSTIRNCDRIIVLDGGHIVEDGTYEELIANEGFFSELVKRQMTDR